MRRSSLILMLLAGLALVAGVVYSLIGRGKPTPPPSSSSQAGGVLPEVPPFGAGTATLPGSGGTVSGNSGSSGSENFGVVSQSPALSFFVAADNSVLFIQPDGQVFRVRAGNETALSTNKIADLISASFSADGRFLLVVLGPRSAPEFSVFDVQNKTWTPLPAALRAAAWSSSGGKLAFLHQVNDGVVLTTLDEETPNAKPQDVLTLHMEDVRLLWNQSSTILVAEPPSAFVKNSFWAVDLKTKTIRPFLEGEGVGVMWNASGTRGLMFTAGEENHGGTLAFIDGNGTSLRKLPLSTLPSKCAFKESSPAGTGAAPGTSTPSQPVASVAMYCALPRDVSGFQKAVLPDDYLKRSLFTADDIYAVNENGDLTTIQQFPVAVDAQETVVRNQKLFFINRLDQKIYVVTLPAGS